MVKTREYLFCLLETYEEDDNGKCIDLPKCIIIFYLKKKNL